MRHDPRRHAVNAIPDWWDACANRIETMHGASNAPPIAGLARVEPTRFVGQGPWRPTFVGSGDIQPDSEDPRLVYQDALVGLAVDHDVKH